MNFNNLMNITANVVGEVTRNNQQQQQQQQTQTQQQTQQQETNFASASSTAQPAAGASGIEALGSIIGGLPLEQQKDLVFGYLGPVIKAMSPKWGDAIVAILRAVDIPSLLALGKNQEDLEKRVKEEEGKLEEGEIKKNQ